MQKRREHTIAEILLQWELDLRVSNRSDQTIEDYFDKIRRFIWWMNNIESIQSIKLVDPNCIKRFIYYIQTDPNRWGRPSKILAGASIQDYYRTLRTFFNWCEYEEIIDLSPFHTRRLKMPKARQKIIEGYVVEDVQALLRAARRYDITRSRRDTAIILTLYDTGIRAGELCGLTLDDIYKGSLKVIGKGDRERYVQISPPTEKSIRDYINKERPDCEGSLFLSLRKLPLTRYGLYQMIKERAKQAGLNAAGLHKFRHAFAISWLVDGGPVNVLQAILGHSSPTMSMRYAQVASSAAKDLHRQHSPVARLDSKRPR